MYRIDDRLPMNASGDGVLDFIGFRPTSAAVIKVNRLAEEASEVDAPSALKKRRVL